MKLEVFNYDGDGIDNRVIEFSDCTPNFVWMSAKGTNGVCRTSTMADGMSKPLNGTTTVLPDMIKSFGTNQMVVGTNQQVNEEGFHYFGFAIEDNCDGDFCLMEYDGDSTDDRTIQLEGITNPAFVMLAANELVRCVYRTNLDPTVDEAHSFTSGGFLTNTIQEIGEDFIIIGSALDSNGVAISGPTHYHLVAIANVSGIFDVSGYAGTGIGGQSITGVGFEPELGFVQGRANLARFVHVKHHTVHTDPFSSALDPNGDPNSQTNECLNTFDADGYTIDGNGNVNGVGETYQAIMVLTGDTGGSCEEEEVCIGQPILAVPDCRAIASASHPPAVFCRIS